MRDDQGVFSTEAAIAAQIIQTTQANYISIWTQQFKEE